MFPVLFFTQIISHNREGAMGQIAIFQRGRMVEGASNPQRKEIQGATHGGRSDRIKDDLGSNDLEVSPTSS